MHAIQLNHRIKKASRHRALGIIQLALEKADRKKNNVGTIDRDELEAIFKYFLPSTSKRPAKTAEQWVAKACAPKDEQRLHLQYLYSDGRRLMGCDGHRLHWIKTNEPQGFYCPLSFMPIDSDAKPIKINKLIPKYKKLKTYLLADYPIKIHHHRNLSYQVIDQCAFNSRYLGDAANGGKKIRLAIDSDDPTKAYGANEFGKFLVMGMRIPEEESSEKPS